MLAAAGAAAMYFLDPENGPERRRRIRSRVLGVTRAEGPGTLDHSYNDPTLAAKVESELFVGLDIPSDRVKINAENGIIVLRGEVDRAEQIGRLERAAAKIPGVLGVRTLLHLPNTPAPNKAEALDAG